MLKKQLLLWFPTALILNSCSYDATQLYVVHQTVIGIDAAVNNEQKAGHLLIGYDRRFLTISPKSVPMSESQKSAKNPQETMAPQSPGPQPKDVMAVLSCSHMEIDGLFLTKFVERLATGKAAKNFSEKNKVFDCSDIAK